MRQDGVPVVAFFSRALDSRPWTDGFARTMPEAELRIYPDLGDLAEVDVLCAFRPPEGLVASLPKLKLFQVLGAGTDHLSGDTTIPRGVPMARLVDESTMRLMGDYVLAAVLRHHRELDHFGRMQKEHVWKRREPRMTGDKAVGVLGLGLLGAAVASRLKENGFRMRAWTKSQSSGPEDVELFSGNERLGAFFDGLDGVVCLLPLVPETFGMLNRERLLRMNPGAFLVNAGRGQHVREADLRELLDSGHLSGATLDVVDPEPPAAESWLWDHPKIFLTPHVATLPRAETAVGFVAENIRRVLSGARPKLEVAR